MRQKAIVKKPDFGVLHSEERCGMIVCGFPRRLDKGLGSGFSSFLQRRLSSCKTLHPMPEGLGLSGNPLWRTI
jgi:hypothetical protein